MKKVLAILLAIAMVFAMVACSSGNGGSDEDLEPIKIGSIQDLSGTASAAGQANAWGVERAVQEINDAGGINGRQIELTTLDCENDAEVGVTCYRQLVDEYQVDAIIGPPLSNPASAWVELATEDEMPIVGHFMDDVCTLRDDGSTYEYMFLVEPSCSTQSYIIADYGMNELGLKSFSFMYNASNAFAASHEKAFVEYVNANGGSVLNEETFTWSDTDFSAQAQKIAAANPDCVFLSDYAAQAAIAYDALRDAGYTGVILGANTISDQFASLCSNTVENTYFLANYDIYTEDDSNLAYTLVKDYADEAGITARYVNADFGYDAMKVLAAALTQANDPTDGAEVRDILENNISNVELCYSTITIDPATHQPTADMGMFICMHDGQGGIEVEGYFTTEYGF